MFAAYVVPSLITQFNQKFPDVHIQLIEGNTAELEEMLGSNALDFVIDNYHYDSILYNKELYCEENILLAVPKHFAVNEELGMYQLSYKNIKNKNYLNQKYPAVPLGRFADLPFIMLTQGMILEPEETGCAEMLDLSPILCWNSISSRQHIWPRLRSLEQHSSVISW